MSISWVIIGHYEIEFEYICGDGSLNCFEKYLELYLRKCKYRNLKNVFEIKMGISDIWGIWNRRFIWNCRR